MQYICEMRSSTHLFTYWSVRYSILCWRAWHIGHTVQDHRMLRRTKERLGASHRDVNSSPSCRSGRCRRCVQLVLCHFVCLHFTLSVVTLDLTSIVCVCCQSSVPLFVSQTVRVLYVPLSRWHSNDAKTLTVQVSCMQWEVMMAMNTSSLARFLTQSPTNGNQLHPCLNSGITQCLCLSVCLSVCLPLSFSVCA